MPLTRFLCLASTLLSLAVNTLAQQAEPIADKPPAAAETAPAPAPVASSPAPRPPVKNPEPRDMELLAKSAEAHTVAWLQAGDEKVLALYEPDRTGTPQGAVLILHDEGQHPNWPHILENIRAELPEFGWATLAVALPRPDKATIPPRPAPPPPPPQPAAAEEKEKAPTAEKDAASQQEPQKPQLEESEEIFDAATGELISGEEKATAATEPETKKEEQQLPAIPAEQRVEQRMRAALAFLQEKGQFNLVLLGDGLGAARAGNFLRTLAGSGVAAAGPSKKAAKPVHAVVLIDARNRIPSTEVDLPSCFHDPDIPVLDIYFSSDRHAAEKALRRKRYAQRNHLNVYRQIRLPELAGNFSNGENRVTRRVRGFLEKYVQGMEMSASQR